MRFTASVTITELSRRGAIRTHAPERRQLRDLQKHNTDKHAKLQFSTKIRAVTSEVASSSLVHPAIQNLKPVRKSKLFCFPKRCGVLVSAGGCVKCAMSHSRRYELNLAAVGAFDCAATHTWLCSGVFPTVARWHICDAGTSSYRRLGSLVFGRLAYMAVPRPHFDCLACMVRPGRILDIWHTCPRLSGIWASDVRWLL